MQGRTSDRKQLKLPLRQGFSDQISEKKGRGIFNSSKIKKLHTGSRNNMKVKIFCYKNAVIKAKGYFQEGGEPRFRGSTLNEFADKPGSVAHSHSSGIRVTAHLKQPT